MTCSEDSKIISFDIPVLIDNHPVTTLVDNGADYRVINGSLAAQLRKVTTPWFGSPIRTADGHLVAPMGACTATVPICGATFPGSFIGLLECSRQLMLRLNFLREYGAVINLRKLVVTFSTPRTLDDESERPT
ncbi:hypothetical protein HPB48_018335 [Haemaphysalis longicornis]|uniref:Peptidase A2 domain-containing protein n=1 Tax=Haemaphysalis longicornis TaxID=44386 RepID=A0A9J6FNY6_HAELO|nr:hypothetical protein HPB48_018335 [Haemaphysalis longicornis]